jgi:hypothetical protein
MNRKIDLQPSLGGFVAGCSGPCSKIDPITAPQAGGGRADSADAPWHQHVAGYESGGLVYRHQEPLSRHRAPGGPAHPPGDQRLQPRRFSGSSRSWGRHLQYQQAPTNDTLSTAYQHERAERCRRGRHSPLLTPDAGRTAIFGIIARHHGTILQVEPPADLRLVQYGANGCWARRPASGTPSSIDDIRNSPRHARRPPGFTLNAKLALFTVPDESISFVTTIAVPESANGAHIPLIGPDGLLAETTSCRHCRGFVTRARDSGRGGQRSSSPDQVVLGQQADTPLLLDSYNGDIIRPGSAAWRWWTSTGCS